MRDLLDRLRYGRARTLLSSYIDGELSERERRRVERHLSECERCRWELESLRLTAELARGLPEMETSRSFALSREPAAVKRGGLGWMSGTRMAAAVAAVLVVAVLAGMAGLLRMDGAGERVGGSGSSDAGGSRSGYGGSDSGAGGCARSTDGATAGQCLCKPPLPRPELRRFPLRPRRLRRRRRFRKWRLRRLRLRRLLLLPLL